MNVYLKLLIFLFGMYLSAQEKSELIEKENNFVFGTNLSLGRTILPDKSLGVSLALDFKNRSLFGFGILLNAGSYSALNLNNNPRPEEIENYNSQTDEDFEDFNYIDGNTKDKLMMNTFYLSKGFKLNKKIIIDIQIGPSLNIYRIQKYSYRYNSPFYSFSGSSPGSFFAKSSESKVIIMGFNLRGCLYYSVNSSTVLSLSPYINFNRESHLFGLQFGFVFGKKYKKNLFLN